MSLSEDSIEHGDSFDVDSINSDLYTYDDEFFTPKKTDLNVNKLKEKEALIFDKDDTGEIYPIRKAVSCTTCNFYDTKISRKVDGGFPLRKVASCSMCTWDVDEFTEEDFKGSISDDSYGPIDGCRSRGDTSLESNDEVRPRLQRTNSYTKAMDEQESDNEIKDNSLPNIQIDNTELAPSSTSSPSYPRLPPDGGESIIETESSIKATKKEHEKLISSSLKNKSKSPFRTFSIKKNKEKKQQQKNCKKQDSLDRNATDELDEIFGKLKKTPQNSFDNDDSAKDEELDEFNLSFSKDSFLNTINNHNNSSSSSPKKSRKILQRLLPPTSLFTTKRNTSSKLHSQRSKSVEFLYTNEPSLEDVNKLTKSFSSMELALCGLTDEDEVYVENINEQWITYLKKIGGMTIFGGNESLRYVWYQITCFQKDILQHFEDFLKTVIDEFQQVYKKCQELEGVITLKTEQQERETSKIYDDVERAMHEEREKLQEKHIEKEEQTRSEFVKLLEQKELEIKELQKQNQTGIEKYDKLQDEVSDFKQNKDIADLQLVTLLESDQQSKEHIKALEEELLLIHGRLNEELIVKKELQDNLEVMTKEAHIEKENYKQCLRRCQDLLEEKEFLDVSINNLSCEVEDLKQQKQKYNYVNNTPNGIHVNNTPNNYHVNNAPYINDTLNSQPSFDENYNHPALAYRRSISPNSETSSSSFPEEYRPTTPVIQTPSGMAPLRPRLPSIEQSNYLLSSTAKKQLQYRNTAQTPIKLASSNQTDFKVIFTGDMNVGKTSLIRRIALGKFRASRDVTLEADYSVKDIEYDEKKVVLKLWDTVGQERFNSIPTSYYRKSDVVLLMYDITEETSFLNAKTWIKIIHENTNENIFLLLVGNKADLHHKRQISIEKGKLLAKDHDAMFIETSAKSGENIKELCDMIASTLLDRDDTLFIRNNFENSLVCSLTTSVRRNRQSNNICCQ